MSNVQESLAPSAALVDAIVALEPAAPWQPTHEIVRTARGVTIVVDLPGVLPANVHVACRNGRLSVWGGRAEYVSPSTLERICNRPSGPFALDAVLPECVEPSRIRQEFHDGVLTISIPKRRESIKSRHEA